ncbi:P22 phage major capsid protein family protein [Leifsonia sp. TF02-11]|uniref:P22 phage major capsid protein family protein n=1 Tax=Leifsonia sp. TF02-11 TaxID=2815212 RepID=UPI001AA12710|nr:P22 phage major capsid protein family protein [Leifsonia sp. TF02-11]MBO1739673.1 hypothetical protein [Leifsonia sp. TF02-11]
MVNSTTAAPFIPQIWANEALEILRANIQLAPRVTRDSDLATFQVGSTLHIPYPGTLVANDKVQGSPVTLQTPNSTDTTVTLNKHKEATILVEDFVRAQAQPILMQSYIEAQVVAIAEQVENDIIATYSLFSGSVGTSGTDLSAATLRAAAQKFTDNKVKKGNRNLLLSTKDVTALRADSSLQNFFAYNDGRDGTITTGELPRIYGLQLLESQLTPVVAGTPNSTKNFAFDPGAIVLASRALPEAPAGQGAVQSTIVDEVSGLVLRVTMSYSPNNLGSQVTIDVLYGVAKLRDQKGFVVLA